MVELALVLPIFLLILMTLVDFGRVVYAQHTINQDAAEAARVGAVSADSLSGNAAFTAKFLEIRTAATRMAPAVPRNTLTTAAASIKGDGTRACSAVVGAVTGASPAMPNDGTTGACFYPNGTNNSNAATPARIVVKIDITVSIITPIISHILGGSIPLHAESSQLLQ